MSPATVMKPASAKQYAEQHEENEQFKHGDSPFWAVPVRFMVQKKTCTMKTIHCTSLAISIGPDNTVIG